MRAEAARVSFGPEPGQQPEGIGTVRFFVHCDGNAEQVLEKGRTVLSVVLEHSVSSWPRLDQWRALLPKWFVAACAPERTQEQAEQWLAWWQSLPVERQTEATRNALWTLSEWLYWFESERREWFWWDARVDNSDQIIIAVQVTGWPFPWDSLRWLFRACGAKDVVAEKD